MEVQVQGPGGINKNGVKILPVFSQLPRALNKNTCTRCKSYWGVTDFTRTVNSSKAFRGIPSEKRWRSYCKVSDGSPGAAIKVPNFYPRIAAAAFRQKKNSRIFRHGSLSNFYYLQLLLFFRALHQAECEVCTRRFIV